MLIMIFVMWPIQVKKKVWTKLKNGLYGYRIVKTVKKLLSAEQLMVPEQGSPSAGAKLHEKFKSSMNSQTGGRSFNKKVKRLKSGNKDSDWWSWN